MILCSRRRFEEAVPLAEQALAAADANLGPNHRVAINARASLGAILRHSGRFDASVALLRVTAESCERHYGPLDAATLSVLHELGQALTSSGQLEEARRLIEMTLERFARVYGFCHIRTAGPLGALEWVMRLQSDFTTLRNLYQQWILGLLAAPLETDQFLRHRRRAAGERGSWLGHAAAVDPL